MDECTWKPRPGNTLKGDTSWVYGWIIVMLLFCSKQCVGFELWVNFVFLNAATPAHLSRYGSKLRVYDLAIPAGVQGWESYPPVCVCVCVCACACVSVCVCVRTFVCVCRVLPLK